MNDECRMLNEGSTVAEAMVDREGWMRNILSPRDVIVTRHDASVTKGENGEFFDTFGPQNPVARKAGME
jgi:hypothetical protein